MFISALIIVEKPMFNNGEVAKSIIDDGILGSH